MLVKLNKNNKGKASYEPPIPVVRNFDDIDRSAPPDEQIEGLLWIVAVLVCRFLHQFPFLYREGDELFSVGMIVVVDSVHNTDTPGDKIGSHIHTNACSAMEAYCNNLDSVVNMTTRTRYRYKERGKEIPTDIRLTAEAVVEDDHTEIIVRDAAKTLGIDLENATLHEKRRLHEFLTKEKK